MPSHAPGKRVAERQLTSPRGSATANGQAGKRRAEKPTRVSRRAHEGSRRKLIPALPSIPSLVGATALAVAATGAMSMSAASPATVVAVTGPQSLSGQANVLNGTSSIGISSAFENREKAVSRDSARQALADAAQEELEEAAEAQAEQRAGALAELAANAEKHAQEIALNAWKLPVAAGVYRLTSRFGECSFLWANCHTGLDFAAPSGTPVMSVANGTVTETSYAGSYGNRIIVTLDDGTEIWYAHLSGYAVNAGETVTGGSVIGYVGSTGNSTGPHLHLEVRPGAGDAVDPYTAMTVKGESP